MLAIGALPRHVTPDAYSPASAGGWAGVASSKAMVALADDLEHCQSADSLRDWLTRYALRHGFRGGCYIHLGHFQGGSGAKAGKAFRFLSTHEARADFWLSDGTQKDLMLPVFLPFAWKSGNEESLTGDEREWRSAHGLEAFPAGLTIPVQDHGAGPAYVILFGGTEPDAQTAIDNDAPLLAATAIAFHLRAKAILPTAYAMGSMLSDREIACLRFAALGETLSQTAAKLGISVRTVELHVGRAAKKLSASNKIQAVAIAIGAGLIQV